MTIYDRDYWWSDNWDQLTTGRDYDFSKPFFAQFAELMKAAPLPNLANSNCPGLEYGNHSTNCKNGYLLHASYATEDSAYITGAVEAKDCFDIYKTFKGVQSYEVILSGDINRVFFSYNSDENLNSKFLSDCKNMQESIGCVNMRNRSYCILNKQYTKEEYAKESAKYDFGSYKQLEQFKNDFAKFSAGFPRRYATVLKSTDVTGDHVIHTKNCRNIFDAFGELENCKYAYHAMSLKDCYDGYGFGGTSELLYECVDAGLNATRCFAGVFTHSSQNTAYTYGCMSSSNLFGCVGLRSKQYCILNKQYTKEEYEAIVPKIIKQMQEVPYADSKGNRYTFGEFFPGVISPFVYNETVAQEYTPLTREKATRDGYRWRDSEDRHYTITIKAADLPDHIRNISDSILKEVIECAHKGGCNQQCTTAFKVIPSELQFLKQFNIALPRLCPNCRHYERLTKRNPFKLWKRECQCRGAQSSNGTYKNINAHPHGDSACGVEFETPYSPERKEVVYCEKCYQQEAI